MARGELAHPVELARPEPPMELDDLLARTSDERPLMDERLGDPLAGVEDEARSALARGD
jgi:hypothetical protein